MLFLYLNFGEGNGILLKRLFFKGKKERLALDITFKMLFSYNVEAIGNNSKKNLQDPLAFNFPLDLTISLFINFKMLIQIC